VAAGTATAAGGAGAKRRRALPRFALAIPAWVWFVLFFAIPVMWIVFYSIWGYKPDPFTPIEIGSPSLQNFKDAMTGTFLRTFRGTLQISILGTLLCLLIGFPFAYWLAVKVPPRWRGVGFALVIIPFWTNFLIRTIGWRILLAPEGPGASFLQTIGLLDGPLRFLDTRAAVQLGVVYNYLPLMIFPLFVALDRLDPSLREASKDLGASRFTTFRQVTLPLAMPGIVAGLLLVFIPLTGDFITAAILGGAKGNMVGNMVFGRFLVAQNWAQGSAMAIMLIGMILLTLGVFAAIGIGIRTIVRRRRSVATVATEVA
jgi:spermidine/putrescine transport system permease protein